MGFVMNANLVGTHNFFRVGTFFGSKFAKKCVNFLQFIYRNPHIAAKSQVWIALTHAGRSFQELSPECLKKQRENHVSFNFLSKYAPLFLFFLKVP